MMDLVGFDFEEPLKVYSEKVCEMLASRLETLTGITVTRPLTESGIIDMLRTEGIRKEAQKTVVQNAVMIFALDMATVLNPGRGQDEPDVAAHEEPAAPSIPQLPLPDFKKWDDPLSRTEYDEAPDELPLDNDGMTKHRSRVIYFTDALVKKDDDKYGVICFDCVKIVKVDGWAKHSSAGKKHLENAEQRRRKFGGVSRGTRRGSAAPDHEAVYADMSLNDLLNESAQMAAPQTGNGRRRRKQAGRGIKHPTKQQVSLLKKAIKRITR